MTGINIPRVEQEAIRAIDLSELDRLIKQCTTEENPYGLRELRLDNCGPHISSSAYQFEQALLKHSQSKTAKKREETEYYVDRAKRNLVYAVSNMKEQVDVQQQEKELFYIDDRIIPPSRLTEKISLRVSYQWRRSAGEEWVSGSINFIYNVTSQQNIMASRPSRKPSASEQESKRQETLYREWEHLMSLALHSVRKHFRNGGDAASIPKEFQVKNDSQSGGLNNYSADF